MGARTEQIAIKAIDRVVAYVALAAPRPSLRRIFFEVTQVAAMCDFGAQLFLSRLAADPQLDSDKLQVLSSALVAGMLLLCLLDLCIFCQYNPDLNPSLNYQMIVAENARPVKLHIFSSGKMTLMGDVSWHLRSFFSSTRFLSLSCCGLANGGPLLCNSSALSTFPSLSESANWRYCLWIFFLSCCCCFFCCRWTRFLSDYWVILLVSL